MAVKCGSQLLALPYELRQEIFYLALPHNIDIYSCTSRVFRYHWASGSVALLRTCKQIAAEATPLFYGYNGFDVILHGRGPRLLIEYLDGEHSNEDHTDGCNRRLSRSHCPITDMPTANVRLIRQWHLVTMTRSQIERFQDSPLGGEGWWWDHIIMMMDEAYRVMLAENFADFARLIGPKIRRIELTIRAPHYANWVRDLIERLTACMDVDRHNLRGAEMGESFVHELWSMVLRNRGSTNPGDIR